MSHSPNNPPEDRSSDKSEASSLMAELHGSGGGYDDPLSMNGAQQSALNKHAPKLVAVAIVLVAVGGLVVMRRQGMSGGDKIQDVTIDYDLKKLDRDRLADHAQLLDQLKRMSEPLGVSSDDVAKNPFLLPIGHDEPTVASNAMTPEQRAELELRTALRNMELQAVMGGAKPMCQIDHQLFSIGDVMSNGLQVTAIEGRSATVSNGKRTFRLSIGAAPLEVFDDVTNAPSTDD